jgi:hypothetical protein
MTSVFRVNALAAAAVIFILPIAAPADTRSRPLNEDAAVNLLERTLKRDRVYEKRISLGCITYDTEETTDSYFQFALREKHDAKCGGDPETSPVVKRYRVHRRSGKIEQWEAASDTWHAYKGAQTK